MELNTKKYTLLCRVRDAAGVRTNGTVIVDGITYRIYSIETELETYTMELVKL